MSYARFGLNGSDVYVFPHVGGGFECCMCSLGPSVKTIFTTGYKDHPIFGNIEPCKYCNGKGCEKCMSTGSVRLNTRSEMIAHLKEHIKNGDTVPSYAIEKLEEELKTDGEFNYPLFDDGYDGPIAINFKDGTIKKMTELFNKDD